MADIKETENVLWSISEMLRTEIDSSEYRKVAVAIIAASRLASETEWQDIRKAETSAQVTDLMNALLAGYDLEGMLPKCLGDLGRDILDDIMEKCENFDGAFADVYEYCLRTFAREEGKDGGEFYTPPTIHELIRQMFLPESGASIYDPCCGAGSVFFRMGEGIHAFGQEKNPDTWLMAKAAAAVQGMPISIGDIPGDTIKNDLHRGELYDYVVSNPPFNVKMKSRLPDDGRWICGRPEGPTENYAWLEHMLSHLKDDGHMACVLTTTSLTSSAASDRAIRKEFLDRGYVDAAIVLPRGLFYSTTIPVCLWLMSRKKTNRVLFINSYDAFDEKRIRKIASCWHSFINGGSPSETGFCACASVSEIAGQKYTLSPNSYISFSEKKADSDIQYVTLDDACDIVRGGSKPGGSLYPLYGSSGAYAQTDTLCPVSETVLIGRKGTIGNPRYVKGSFGVSSSSFYIKKVKIPDLSLRYLYFYLQTVDFSAFDSGSGAPSLSHAAFRSVLVPVPDIATQNSISDAMMSADAACESLSKSADAAADLITMMYRRIFHDQSDAKFCRLDQICHIKKGETPVGNGTKRFLNTSAVSSPTVHRYAGTCSSTHIAPPGSLFISYKLSMGRVSVSPLPCTWNEGLAMLDAKEPVRIYLFCFFRDFMWDQLPSTSCLGRAVNLKIISSIRVPVPDAEKFKKFVRMATPVWKNMLHDAAEAVYAGERRGDAIRCAFEVL